MKLRFQADADLNQRIVLAVVRLEPEVDFQTASAADLESVDDAQVLERASAEGRALVTHDRRTMPGHFADFLARGSSAGVLIVPQSLPIAAAAEDLVLIWSLTSAEEWIDRIFALPI